MDINLIPLYCSFRTIKHNDSGRRESIQCELVSCMSYRTIGNQFCYNNPRISNICRIAIVRMAQICIILENDSSSERIKYVIDPEVIMPLLDLYHWLTRSWATMAVPRKIMQIIKNRDVCSQQRTVEQTIAYYLFYLR